MSMFEDNRYRWRETYFVLFRSGRRPTLKQVEEALAVLDAHYVLTNLNADEDGRFDSLTLRSPDDYSALDVCYTAGPEVIEQGAALVEEMCSACGEEASPAVVQQVRQADARFDVLHFEQVPDDIDEEEADEMLDPSALLLVLSALARLSDGVALDPQGGTILSEED